MITEQTIFVSIILMIRLNPTKKNDVEKFADLYGTKSISTASIASSLYFELFKNYKTRICYIIRDQPIDVLILKNVSMDYRILSKLLS